MDLLALLRKNRNPSTLPTVWASEIGDLMSCNVRFKLEKVDRIRPADPETVAARRSAGSAFHSGRDRELKQAEHITTLGRTILTIGLIALAVMLLLNLAACTAQSIETTSAWTGALGAGLIMLAIALLRISTAARERAAIPKGIRLIASDLGRNRTRTLRDPSTGLASKPDWIVSRRYGIRLLQVAVELKSRRSPRVPFESHVLQLATEVLTLRASVGRRAALRGYLVYTDRHHEIVVDNRLRSAVLSAAEEVRTIRKGGLAIRNHDNPRRCSACPFRTQCDQSLAA